MTIEPIWIVNDNSELGVMVNGICYFLYKAGNLTYENSTHDDGSPMYIRPLFKREFGECCLPLDICHLMETGEYKDKSVSLSDSDNWVKMPKPPANFQPSYLRGSEFMPMIKQETQ
jgi:hypothetical protein